MTWLMSSQSIWIVLTLFGTAFAVWLLHPLLSRSGTADTLLGGRDRRLQIYRDQLAELDRDHAAGLIGEAERSAARIEIERRMLRLAASDTETEETPQSVVPRRRWRLGLPLAAILITGPLLVYTLLGQPKMPDQPIASRSQEARDRAELIAQANKLQETLKAKPDDAQGWVLYAGSLRLLGRMPESIAAYEQALKVSSRSPEVAGALAELLTEQANGTVTPRALGLFQDVVAKQPEDPRARYYVALAKAQAGDAPAALDLFVALAETSPRAAPWLPTVQARIDELSKQLGRPSPQLVEAEPAETEGKAAEASSDGAGEISPEAMAKMSDAERRVMIETMVSRLDARLQENPDDPDGWLRLGRSYRVLGDAERSLAALAEGARRAPARLDIQLEYAHALFAPGTPGTPPPEFIAAMRKILAIDPNQAEALWFVGRAEASLGNSSQAVDLLNCLLQRLPADAPIRGKIEQAIAEARKG